MNVVRVSLASLCALGLAVGTVSYAAPSNASEPVPEQIDELFRGGLPAWEDRQDEAAPTHTLEARMTETRTPAMAMAILKDGEVAGLYAAGEAEAGSGKVVDIHSVFSAGSVSKLVNAALIMRLVDAGVLDLDEDVNAYLTSWKIPDSDTKGSGIITLRQLLSHTSGLSQHGFPDFLPGELLPTVLETLNGTGAAKHDAVRSLFEPGSEMKYSGGGVTVSQLVVTDVTGLSYPEAAKKYVLEPLGMTRSTFANPLPEDYGNIAYAHDEEGKLTALPRGYEAMPEMAASGLWTSAHDLGKFVQAIASDSGFLSSDSRAEMLTRQPNSWYGLGPRLNGSGEKRVFHHGGANNSYQTWIEMHLGAGDGLVVLTNGAGGRKLAYEMRIALGRDLGWLVNFPDDLRRPEFAE